MAINRKSQSGISKRKNSPRQSKLNAGVLWLFLLIGCSFSFLVNKNLKFSQFFAPQKRITLTQTDNPVVNPSKQPSQNLQIASTNSLHNINYSQIDQKAASINYKGTSVAELASLLSQFASTEPEKARIIYAWIAYHIAYNVPAFLSGNYANLSPEEVLQYRQAICSGYANLYQALANKMGLESTIIEGYGKGASYSVGTDTKLNHAWNGVKINNQWYLIDSTWGAGIVHEGVFSQKFNPHYFATPPEEFIYDHFPSETNWQLLGQPYSKEKFDSLPQVSSQFFKNHLQFVNYNTSTIQANDQLEIRLTAPDNIIASARLKSNSQILGETYTFVQKSNGEIVVNVAFPAPGNYELEIFSKESQETGVYPLAVTYKIMAQTASAEFPQVYSTFSENHAYLYTPRQKILPANQSINFHIDVPNAIEVQVIDSTSNNWTPLSRYGSSFTGNVSIGSGKLQVMAKFPGDTNRYWTLLQYN